VSRNIAAIVVDTENFVAANLLAADIPLSFDEQSRSTKRRGNSLGFVFCLSFLEPFESRFSPMRVSDRDSAKIEVGKTGRKIGNPARLPPARDETTFNDDERSFSKHSAGREKTRAPAVFGQTLSATLKTGRTETESMASRFRELTSNK
jgi:hypothetical protein